VFYGSDITVLNEGEILPPPLRVMSISIKSTKNEKKNNQYEIVCITTLIHNNVLIDLPT